MKVWIGADTEKASRLSLIWDYRTPSIETVNKGCGHIDIVILGTILESLGLSREQRAPILTPLWQQLSKDNSNIGAHNNV